MNAIRLTTVATTVALLCACAANTNNTALTQRENAIAQKATANVANKDIPIVVNTPGTAAAGAVAAERARTLPVAKHSTGSWVGARTIMVQSDSQLPASFYENFSFNFDDRANRGTVSLAVVAERITRLSGVPVRISGDVYQAPLTTTPVAPVAAAATTPIPARTNAANGPLPTTLAPTPAVAAAAAESAVPAYAPYVQPIISLNSVDMHWNGTLSGFLDHVTARLNLSWSYREGVVVIERYVTEAYEFAAFGSSQDFRMNLSGGGAGGAGNAAIDVTEQGKIEILNTIKASVDQMIKLAGGASVLNLSTGRLTVTTTRDVMNRVRELLKQEDASLKRQAQIQIDVYSVTTNDSDEQGVDWNVVFSKLTESWGATLKSPVTLSSTSAASLGFNIMSGLNTETSKEFGGSTAAIKALNEIGTTAKVRPVTLIAMNRQWARKTNLNVTGYVAETTSSSSSGGTSAGQKTSSITTGDKILVQPAILNNGEIMLKFGISLTELVSLLTVSAGSGVSATTVQTPNTTGIDDQSTVRLRPGEAMVVTGLTRRVAQNNTRTLSENAAVGLGGTQSQSFKREEFMIVVRAFQI